MPPPRARRATPVRHPIPAPDERRRFRRRLLDWYRKCGRDLPWRRTTDPYHILVSEVMLQQTQVDRVLPKYEEWLRRFPSLEVLARAPDDDVVRVWYPLGYNVRPRRLQAIARETVARYGGALPSDEPALRAFKGVGPYTAGAIRSFAFRQRAAIVDTNIARVLFRVFVAAGDPKSHAMKRHLWEVSRAVLPRRQVFDFNQALMDLGATVCVARTPKCEACPLPPVCLAYPSASRGNGARPAQSTDANAGRPAGARPAPVVVAAAVIERRGRFLMTRRPAGTHLEGCWEFPGGKCEAGESRPACLRRELREELDVDAIVERRVMVTRHEYPDRTVELHFYRCAIAGTPRPLLGQALAWVTRNELAVLPLPPADSRLVRLLTRRARRRAGSPRGRPPAGRPPRP
jgi:A/G-specific adenine glycosylase